MDASTDDERPYLVASHAITMTPSLALIANGSASRDFTPSSDLTIYKGYYDDAGRDDEPVRTAARGLPPLAQASREMRVLAHGFQRSVTRSLNRSSFAAFPEEGWDSNALSDTEVLGRSRVLHFIAHGYFDDLQPWRSGLYLWRYGASTFKLEIADVYTMDFRSDLVTLSACQSARESAGPSLGLQGFTQALFSSGARAVLASRWDVDDASAPRFMEQFYDRLAEGSSKSEALRATQLAFSQDPKAQDPFYWAGYVLQGDGRSRIPLQKRAGPRWAHLLLLVGISGLLASVLLVRRSARTH